MGVLITKLLIKIYLLIRDNFLGGKGLGRIALLRELHSSVERVLLKLAPDRIIKDGIKMHLPPVVSLEESIGSYEPEQTRLVVKYLKEGDVFIDVGAFYGWYTLIAAKLVGKRGRVLALEPGPNVFPFLVENIRENGFEDIVSARRLIASDSAGKKELYVIGNHWGWARTKDPRKDYAYYMQNFNKHEDITIYRYIVDSVRIDDIAPPRVDFIKIDVEGVVDPVLRGALHTISQNPSLKLLIEWPSQYVVETLRQMGYSYRQIDDNNFFFYRPPLG